MNEILAVDAGNHEVKVMGNRGPMKFLSILGEYRERNLQNTFGKDDIVFEYNGRKGVAGTLAYNDSEFASSFFGDTKAHDDARIRILIAVHRYCIRTDEVCLVVGQPISKHNPQEKEKIEKMLKGEHIVTVNDVKKKIHIKSVGVAPEGAAAIWAAPQKGMLRIIDIGSGTVNAATIKEKKYIDHSSFTLRLGMDTTKSGSIEEMARMIAAQASKKWEFEDTILVVGGASEKILPHFQTYFPNSSLLRPQIHVNQGVQVLHPIYANAVGFYELARGRFHHE